MWTERLSQTTRGKMLLLLKKQGPSTVAYLSQQLGLTLNAIRQHLAAMERDGLVTQRPVKTGPRKPSLAYSLTPQADVVFPKRQDGLVRGLVHVLEAEGGRPRVNCLMSAVGSTMALDHQGRLERLPLPERLEEVRRIMEGSGSIVEWYPSESGFTIRDFNCPYSPVSGSYPEVCQVQRHFLQCLLGPDAAEVSCAHHDSWCEFQVRLSS